MDWIDYAVMAAFAVVLGGFIWSTWKISGIHTSLKEISEATNAYMTYNIDYNIPQLPPDENYSDDDWDDDWNDLRQYYSDCEPDYTELPKPKKSKKANK